MKAKTYAFTLIYVQNLKNNLLSRKTELNMHADDMKFFLGFRHEPCKDASKASYSSDINPVNGDCIR